MSKPSESKRGSPRVTREEVTAWTHKMGPIFERDIVLDTAILGMLANRCQDCKNKHPLAPHLETLLIALCDGDMALAQRYVNAANRFAKALEVSLKELFRRSSLETELDELLHQNNIDPARNSTTKRQQNDD